MTRCSPLQIISILLCCAVLGCSAQFSGATIQLHPTALTKLASTQLKPLMSNIVQEFSYPLPSSPLPSMPRCLFSAEKNVIVETLSIASINVTASLASPELLITLNSIAATTAPIQFNVQCVLDTPAGKVSMDVAGSTVVEIPSQQLSGSVAIAIQKNGTQAPVTDAFFPVTTLSPILSYEYDASTSKFPFDGYVAEYLQSAVRLSVSQAFRSTVAKSLTDVVGGFLSSAFTIFPQTCNVTYSTSTPLIIFNVLPVCQTITTGDAIPQSDMTLLAPSTNSSIDDTAAAVPACQGTKCWPYATFPNGWVEAFKSCQFCVVNGGAAVSQTADIELLSP